MLRNAFDFVYASPWLKTIISVVLAIGVGFFSNTLVTEITTPEGLAWSSFYKATSFYLVLFFAAATAAFNRYLYVNETDILNFRDSEYCMAYARSKLLPEQIDYYRRKIRSGELDDFNAAMREIRQVLK